MGTVVVALPHQRRVGRAPPVPRGPRPHPIRGRPVAEAIQLSGGVAGSGRDWGGGQRCSTHTQPCSHHISTHVHTCAGCCHPQTKQLSLHLHTPVCVQWTLFSFPSSTPFFCFVFFLKRKQERSQSPLSLPCVSVSVCPFVCLCLSVRAHACCSLLFCSAFWGPIGVECHGGKRGKLAS